MDYKQYLRRGRFGKIDFTVSFFELSFKDKCRVVECLEKDGLLHVETQVKVGSKNYVEIVPDVDMLNKLSAALLQHYTKETPYSVQGVKKLSKKARQADAEQQL